MLDPDDIRKICDVGTWCFKGCDKAIKFYSALYLRCRYLDTGTITFYKEIVSDALEYPEVYDIIQYMFRKGEVKEMIPVSSKAGSVKPVYMYVNPGAPFKAIRIVQGDICKLETDAIVVPTDSHCSGKGGLDLSVHKKAGEELRLYIDDYLKKKGGQGWKDPGDCYEYMKAVKEQTEKGSKATDETSAYAKTLHQWDYNTCLAYIVYLQRLAYWSGGMEHPLYDQIANGTIRRVLCRMRKLAD